MQFKGKLMNQTWENGKKLNFGPDFGLFDAFGPNLAPHLLLLFLWVLTVRHCRKLSLCAFKENVRSKFKEMVKNILDLI